MTLFRDVFIVSGSGVGGGSLGYANTLYRARPAFFRDPQWSELGRLGGRAGAALRHRGVDARRRPSTPTRAPPTTLLHELGEELGVGETYKPTPGRRLLRRAGQAGRRPVLRRRGAGAHAAASTAAAAWSAAATARRTRWSRTTSGSPSGSASRSCPSGSSPTIRPIGARRRLAGLPPDHRAPRRLAAAAPAHPHRARRGHRGGRAGHEPAARALQARRLAAPRSPTASASSCGRTASRSSP